MFQRSTYIKSTQKRWWWDKRGDWLNQQCQSKETDLINATLNTGVWKAVEFERKRSYTMSATENWCITIAPVTFRLASQWWLWWTQTYLTLIYFLFYCHYMFALTSNILFIHYILCEIQYSFLKIIIHLTSQSCPASQTQTQVAPQHSVLTNKHEPTVQRRAS